MNARERLRALIDSDDGQRVPWLNVGPTHGATHYKRITADRETRGRLARMGAAELMTAYGKHCIPLYTQAVIAGAMLSGEYDRITCVTPFQFGKLIAHDTPVLTADGWTTHGQVKPGDMIATPSGFRKVIATSRDGYANRIVEFTDGTRIQCHARHEWVVHDRDAHRDRVMETDAIKARKPHGRSVFMLPHCAPLDGETKPLPDPYTFGVWLGDGSTSKGQITCVDDEIVKSVRKAYPNGKTWTHKTTGVNTWSIVGFSRDVSRWGLCSQVKTIPKYIPDDYMTASLDQRLELLAGLIDTDGTRDGNSRYYITTAGPELRDSIVRFLATFGWRSSVVEMTPRTSTSGIVGRRPYWQIGFNVTLAVPSRLKRKRTERLAKHKRIGIKSITECAPVAGRCIEVDGGVYCVGDRLLPTHNSFLMGHVSLLLARRGVPVYIGANTSDLTSMIMSQAYAAVRDARQTIKNDLVGDAVRKVDKIGASLSKQRIGFVNGGAVEALTLGGTYQDIEHNKALGKGGIYILDEAALIPDDVYAETLRSNFARMDGKRYLQCAISNPHGAGWFYDDLTCDDPDPRHLIVWMDALTAIQDGRWTAEHVLAEAERMSQADIQRYLLCELPKEGQGMFLPPKVGPMIEGRHFMGVDAAYKGKDNITMGHAVMGENFHIADVETVIKSPWIDGVTENDIADTIARVYFGLGCELCCIDLGKGIWLKTLLRARGVNVLGVNFGEGTTPERKKEKHYSATNGANKRAEMHLDLQSLMDEDRITWSESAADAVRDTLPYVTAERKPNGKLLVEKKEVIKQYLGGRSPDELDAVLLAIHAGILSLYESDFIL